jgi:hypothetical protein
MIERADKLTAGRVLVKGPAPRLDCRHTSTCVPSSLHQAALIASPIARVHRRRVLGLPGLSGHEPSLQTPLIRPDLVALGNNHD